MNTIYDVLRRPIITEKSNFQNANLHQYTFEVTKDANKGLIKDAIETLFDVSVVRVNLIASLLSAHRPKAAVSSSPWI
jgi:large subunit ribosomal protein L23